MAKTTSTKASKSPSSSGHATKAGIPKAPAQHVLKRWLSTNSSTVGKHPLHLMAEQAHVRSSLLDEVRAVVRTHYVSPTITAQRIASLGAPATAKVLKELLPKTKSARSGDFGEVLATEVAEQTLGFDVPVRRLRWKDGRNMALRGDDIIGIRIDGSAKLRFLKGESKSYAKLTNAVVAKAAVALDSCRGRPGRHAVLFIAARLRESGIAGDETLATQLEGAVLMSFSGCAVEHFLFVLAGNDPSSLLTSHLKSSSKKRLLRHAVGVRILDHSAFISTLFGGL